MNTRIFIGLSLMLALVCWTCGSRRAVQQKEIVQQKAEVLIIDSLIAENLSEDGTIFSTMEDEIILWWQLFHCENRKLKKLQPALKQYANWTFGKEQRRQFIGDTLPMSIYQKHDSVLLVFSLLELDEDQPEVERLENVRKRIAEGRFLREKDKLMLDSLAGFDDYLGYQHLFWENDKRVGHFELHFKGVQLFDRYHYRLKCRLE